MKQEHKADKHLRCQKKIKSEMNKTIDSLKEDKAKNKLSKDQLDLVH